MNYAEQLADPRWKQKREQILFRDNHTCISCGSKQSLHVHHLKYTGFAWEAPDVDLITLCASCHESVHEKSSSKLSYLGIFFMTYAHAITKLLQEGDEAQRTVMYLTTQVKSENQVYFRQSKLARELGVSRATVERHIRKARDIGVLVPDPKEEDLQKGIHVWRLCPYLVWIGDGLSMRAYLKQLPANHAFHAWAE